jgi:hypothetical protein
LIRANQRIRTADRPCADGLDHPAISLHRRAVPEQAAFWLVVYVFGASILGSAAGVLVVGSLSAANRLAPHDGRAQAISSYLWQPRSSRRPGFAGVCPASRYAGEPHANPRSLRLPRRSSSAPRRLAA